MPRWCFLLVLAAAACSDRSRPAPAAGSASAATAVVPRAAPAFSVDDAVRLFEAVATCRLEPHGLDHMCPARNALDRAYDTDLDPRGLRYDTIEAAARAVVAHASPSVRVRAFDQLASDKDEALIVRTLLAERAPMALRAMIFVAPTLVEHHPAVVDAVLGHITHPVPEVRLAVLRALATEYNVAHRGLFEAIALRASDDPDERVRAHACLGLGLLQDPRAVAVFHRLLVATTPPPVFDACGAGLVHTWLADPEREHPVDAAYPRTLALLRKGPHRRGAPGVATIEAIQGLVRGHRTFDDLPPWVDVADLRAYRARIRDPGALADELREHLTDAEAWVGDPPP